MPKLAFFCKVVATATLYLLAMPSPAAAELAPLEAPRMQAESASLGAQDDGRDSGAPARA